MSKIIPNSFQTPNAYIDEYMAFLTPEENVVLSYTARRIFGFHKTQDRISLSQYADGIRTHDGEVLDHGTGLNKKAVRRALDGLIQFGLIREVEPYVKETSTPACYELQLDPDKIDAPGLHRRKAERGEKDSQRTAKGREVATQNRALQSDPSVSDNPPPVLCDTTPSPVLSDTTPPSVSDNPPPVVSDTTTKASGKQSRKPEREIGAQARDVYWPDCLSPQVWKRWEDYRKEIRKELSPTTAEAQIKKLAELNARGHPPEKVIEQSITNGWRGLFELKEEGNGNGSSNRSHSPDRRQNQKQGSPGGVVPERADYDPFRDKPVI